MLILWALLLHPALAGRESWDLLEDALLVESVYGDLSGAARAYEQLVRKLPIEDPARARALFALGRARAELGQHESAREALLEGIRTGSCLDPCQDLLGRIELDEESIRTVPVRWSFDDPAHGFFHPWQFDDKGTIRLQQDSEGENTALVWHTIVDSRKGDQLVVGFRRPTPAPERIRFLARSRATDAWIQVVVVDDLGRAYTLPTGAFWVPSERTRRAVVDLDEMQPLDPLDPPLEPGRLSLLQLRDVSALEGARQGPNSIYIDEFVVE